MRPLFKRRLAEYTWRGRLILAAVVLLLVLLCLVSEFSGFTDRLLLWAGVTADPKTPPLEGEIQVHVLDVGDADAIAVFCDGYTVLIDAGDYGDSDTVTDFLHMYGITHLDYVIATHPDADHIGGMHEVLEQFTVGEYLMSAMPEGKEPTTATYLDLMAYLSDRQIPVTEVAVGTERLLGTAQLTVLSPAQEFRETNEHSVVCRITYRNNRFLFMGDAGRTVEETLLTEDIQADFLKVGHHGADDATGKAFLSAVAPTVAVISCGENDLYDHPHAAVLSDLADSGATVYRTDRHGTVTVIGNGETLKVSTEKE